MANITIKEALLKTAQATKKYVDDAVANNTSVAGIKEYNMYDTTESIFGKTGIINIEEMETCVRYGMTDFQDCVTFAFVIPTNDAKYRTISITAASELLHYYVSERWTDENGDFIVLRTTYTDYVINVADKSTQNSVTYEINDRIDYLTFDRTKEYTPEADYNPATKKYVDEAVSGIVDSAPETLNTLNELAQALGDDPNFATTIANQIGQKANASVLNNYALKTEIPTVTNDLTNDLKVNYDAAYTHSQVAHAPSNAQKNSDITKAEIEAKLTGDITSHTHSSYATTEYVDNAVNTDNLVVSNSISIGRKEGTIIGEKSVAVGYDVTASSYYSHAEGEGTVASGGCSHAEGCETEASGYVSHAEGEGTVASSYYSHAEGSNTKATEQCSHAEGYSTEASGLGSHTEGSNTKASAHSSHAEGNSSNASGGCSHAEGFSTEASGYASHAEGADSAAYGDYSHAEGYYSTVYGDYSHAEGYYSTASGNYSHAEGYCTTSSSENQHVQGKYNIEDTTSTYAHIVGNGTADNAKSNAHTLDWDGNAWFAGDVYVGGTSQDTDSNKLATEAYVDDNVADLQGQIDNLFQNVSNGKELIASAITDKGIYASGEETFQELSDKISSLIIGAPGTTIVGYVDEENDIYISQTEVAAGSYVLKYEDQNGVLAGFDDIGNVEVK